MDDHPQETVVELVIRCDSAITAQYVVEHIRGMLILSTDARVEVAAIFPANIFDAENAAVPA